MFSRFFGKRNKSADVPVKEAQNTRSLVDAQDAPNLAWGKWDRALDAQDSRLPKPAHLAPKTGVPVKPVFRTTTFAAPLSSQIGSLADAAALAENQIDFELPTAPLPLEELSLEQRKALALDTVQEHHQRIANTIRTLWGYRECSVYINRLIMAGGDGMGHARVGFNQDAVAAMLALSDIHDEEFGPPSTLSGALGLST